MSSGFEPIRSYQRIFRPERRIYQVEGHTLPVPGGVPLRWAAYAAGALLAVIVLEAGSESVELLLAAAAALAGFRAGGRVGAALAACASFGAAWLLGLALGLLDWPLRLVVVPAAVATLATQPTPDGRRADRFAVSWLSLWLAPRRRSLDRSLPAGRRHWTGGELWVEADERTPKLRRCRVRGPALVFFSAPVSVRRSGLHGRRVLARPVGRRPARRQAVARLRLGEREALEVRP
ncbi:MAG TPA: hypothetical protein VFI63_03545 [Solirubrobacterales bacterium]|nr:hypothetical protein [Solirubrobacterales bacterium]